MTQNSYSDDPATDRFYAAHHAKEPDPTDEQSTDEYPPHWTAAGGRLSDQLADLSDDDLLTTINAALKRRRGE